MPRAIVLIAVSMLLCGPAPAQIIQAQVINGEGDYEGSSLHTPPPQSDPDAPHSTTSEKIPRESRNPGRDERK